MQETQNSVSVIGKYAAYLSLIEVALGSVLHALRIPFSGNFLSLNQGFLLCRATLEARSASVPYAISNVAAVLKSLAPAGKKLGPMLSLSAQGLLFSIGVFFFGANIIGLSIGMLLLSMWTFLQPLITYTLFFGPELWKAVAYLYEKTLPYHGLSERSLFLLLCSVILLKSLLAVILAFLASYHPSAGKFQDQIFEFAKARGVKPILEAKDRASPFWLALKDLAHPLFLLSFLATAIFLYFSNHSRAEVIWILMRPLAIGFLFFYGSRALNLGRALQRLHGTRWERFAKACQVALGEIRREEKTIH